LRRSAKEYYTAFAAKLTQAKHSGGEDTRQKECEPHCVDQKKDPSQLKQHCIKINKYLNRIFPPARKHREKSCSNNVKNTHAAKSRQNTYLKPMTPLMHSFFTIAFFYE
jgi:hypothetical protein